MFAATETILDEETGQEKQVANQRKTVDVNYNKLSPKVFYNRVQKKIAAISQKRSISLIAVPRAMHQMCLTLWRAFTLKSNRPSRQTLAWPLKF